MFGSLSIQFLILCDLKFSHLNLFKVIFTQWDMLKVMSNHDASMTEILVWVLCGRENLDSLRHFPVLLSKECLLQFIELIAVLQVLSVIEDLNLLYLLHKLFDPFTHFLFGSSSYYIIWLQHQKEEIWFTQSFFYTRVRWKLTFRVFVRVKLKHMNHLLVKFR